MKSILKTILKYYLKIITKLVLLIRKPVVIAIAGSTNKNFVKQEIKFRLQEMGFKARVNPNNFNTEIGLPLSILFLPSGYNEYRKWLPAILKAPLRIFEKNFPEFLVLSLGTSDEGDMKYLLSIIKPNISIITDITQRYKEGFSDMDNLVKEYEILAKNTDKKGVIILNSDNYRVAGIGDNKKQKIIYYGFNDQADARIVQLKKNEKGQKIRIKCGNQESDHQIYKFGKHHAYAFIVGIAVKEELTKNL